MLDKTNTMYYNVIVDIYLKIPCKSDNIYNKLNFILVG